MENRHAWTFASLFLAQALAGAGEAADGVRTTAAAELVPQGGEAPPLDFPDLRLAGAANTSEESRSTAINPKNAAGIAVAVMVDGRCVIRRSGNGGVSFAPPVTLPLPAGDYSRCTGAVVAYAPDGLRLYAAYQAYRNFEGWSLSDVVVSTSANNGASWTDPKVALAGSGDEYDYDDFAKAQLATPLAAADARYVYLTAVKTGYHYHSSKFSRSTDGGQTWAEARTLASGTYQAEYVGSPRVAGGPGGRVVAAWEFADSDGRTSIDVATSLNYGATFAPAFSAIIPSPPAYARQPSVKIGAGSAAQLVYVAGENGGDDGQIRYTYSAKAPYQTWAAPVTLNDDGPGNVHSAPSLTIEPCGTASILHVTWWDGRLPGSRDYVNYTRRLAAVGAAWSPNISISALPSLRRAYEIYGDVTSGGLAAGGGKAFAAWSNFRTVPGTNISQSDVFGSRINSGIDCP